MDNFQILVRLYFQLIQTIHHLGLAKKQVEGEASKAFQHKIKELNNFIKPAQPNGSILAGINEVNKNWALDMAYMLTQHYNLQIKQTLGKINKIYLNPDQKKQAVGVATKWATKRFKNKLSPQTLNDLDQCLQAGHLQNPDHDAQFVYTKLPQNPKQTSENVPTNLTKKRAPLLPTPTTGKALPSDQTRLPQNPKKTSGNVPTNSIQKRPPLLPTPPTTKTLPFGKKQVTKFTQNNSTSQPKPGTSHQNYGQTKQTTNKPNSSKIENFKTLNKQTVETQKATTHNVQTKNKFEPLNLLIAQKNQEREDFILKNPTPGESLQMPKPNQKSPSKTRQFDKTIEIPLIDTRTVHNPQDPLNPNYQKPIKINEVTYQSGTHYFWYQTCVLHDQFELGDAILNAKTLGELTKLADQCTIVRPYEWKQAASNSILQDIFHAKFTQLPEFKQALLESVGQNIHFTGSDEFWGEGKQGKGQNQYGKKLMRFRTEITSPRQPRVRNTTPSPAKSTPPSSPATTQTGESPPHTATAQTGGSPPHTPTQQIQNPEQPSQKFKLSAIKIHTRGISAKNWPPPKPSKTTLVIGDSNMAHINSTPTADVEIYSYPGAVFNNLLEMFKTTPPSEIPLNVILSLGINMRRHAESTIHDQFRRLINRVSKIYPNAQIFVPLVNYSNQLTTKEKDTLDYLNNHIKTYMGKNHKGKQLLDKIPAKDFQTKDDKIHWTLNTGNQIFEHWMSHLNL